MSRKCAPRAEHGDGTSLAGASAPVRGNLSEGVTCALCSRPLGTRVEWHHVVPKSEGGRKTVPVHPICHRMIHAVVLNKELARVYPTLESLREHEDVARFLKWVGNKPPDFHAPTHRRRLS